MAGAVSGSFGNGGMVEDSVSSRASSHRSAINTSTYSMSGTRYKVKFLACVGMLSALGAEVLYPTVSGLTLIPGYGWILAGGLTLIAGTSIAVACM